MQHDHPTRSYVGKVHIDLYTKGAVLRRHSDPPTAHTRGDVGSMSTKSRMRCAFNFENALKPWGWMATLTFETQPAFPKAALARWRRAMLPVLPRSVQWGWLMEFQLRGVVHFHVFGERPYYERKGFLSSHYLERVHRSGLVVDLVRGPLGNACCEAWLEACKGASEKARRFNEGGIVEVLRSPDAAARYVAKEAGKREQKELPEGVEKAGNWWWLNPRSRPVPKRTIVVDAIAVEHLPWRHVFDQGALVDEKLLERHFAMKNQADTLSTQLRLS